MARMLSVLFPVTLLLLGGCCLYLISNSSLLPVPRQALRSPRRDTPDLPGDHSVAGQLLDNDSVVTESQESTVTTDTPTRPINLNQEQNDQQETQGLRKMDLVATEPAKQSQDLVVTTNTPTTAFYLTQEQNPQTAQHLLKMDLVVVPYFIYNISRSKLLEREKEYVTALQRNLDHDLVSCIHVLTTDAEETQQRFNKYELPNRNKLLVSELKSVDRMRDVFGYISLNLVGKDVMFLNADIYLGRGFDYVDPLVMRNQNIMYALSRHVKEEENCAGSAHTFCNISGHYFGSHDAFLFHLHKPIPESALSFLDYKLPSLGMENVLMWVFQRKLNYCTLNPCTILMVFHLHCSEVRNYQNNTRVNNAWNKGRSPFTKKLVCNLHRRF